MHGDPPFRGREAGEVAGGFHLNPSLSCQAPSPGRMRVDPMLEHHPGELWASTPLGSRSQVGRAEGAKVCEQSKG